MKRIPKILGVIVGIIVIPYLLLLIWFMGGKAYDRYDNLRYQPVPEFDSSEWKHDPKYRWVAADYVANHVLRKGMSKSEVEKVLGKPARVEKDGSWQYESKRPGWRFIDWHGGGVLVIYDAAGNMISAENNTWID